METIKNVLGLGGSASKPTEPVVDPEHLSGEEPVSGKMGAGTVTDPYDAGNADGLLFHSSYLQNTTKLTFPT
jgi:hypothetical protein